MRALIVHNPRSGFGSDAIYEFQRALLRAGDECVLRVLTANPQQDERRLADAEEYDLVVVSGGDGTVAHALYALRNRGVATCVFPSGTANLLAANIGNATEPAALAAACRAGRTFSSDLGEISWTDAKGEPHTRGFGLMSGMGFDAQLMHDAIPTKQLLGEAAYFAAVLANVWPKVHHFTIDIDGQTYEHDGISCLVANNAMMQGEIEIVPNCRMDDGMLDVIVLETTGTAQLLAPMLAGIVDPSGREVGRPRIATYSGRDIHVTADEPMKMEIDGDVVTGDVVSWEAHVLPGCCDVIMDALSRYAQQA